MFMLSMYVLKCHKVCMCVSVHICVHVHEYECKHITVCIHESANIWGEYQSKSYTTRTKPFLEYSVF